jgi:hypothetical protein
MKRQNDKQQIAQLLSKFMAGETSLAEEQLLAQYFSTHDVGEEWAEYKQMFALFDSGEVDIEVKTKPKLVALRWAVAAVAASALLLLALRLSLHPAEETPAVTYTATSSQSKPQPVTPPIVKEKPEAVVAEAQPTKQKRKAPPSCVPLVASEQSSSAAPEGATIDPSHDSKTIEAPSVAVGVGVPSVAVGGASPVPPDKQALADIYLAEVALQVAYQQQEQQQAVEAYAASLVGEEPSAATPIIAF